MPRAMLEARDLSILEHIRDYCAESNEALALTPSKEAFIANNVCRNAVAMCVLIIIGMWMRMCFTKLPWRICRS